MIPRKIEEQLHRLAEMFPVVTVTGPRQSGRTTLVRAVFPGRRYVCLENFDLRENHNRLIPIEIKGGSTRHREFGKNLLKLRKLSPKFAPGYVIYSGTLTPEVDGIRFLNYKQTASVVRDHLA